MTTRNIHVTGHAVSRYRERVEAVSYDEAVIRLTSPAIRKAVEIGCASAKLPGGHRVIIQDGAVITVHPKPTISRRRFGRRVPEE